MLCRARRCVRRTPVTSAILHLFVCVQIDPDTPSSPFHGLYLQQHTAEKCWEGRHLNYMLGGGFVGLVIVVLGIPIGNAVYLWRNRMRLEESEMRLRFGFTYDGFRRDACFYESIIMMRKLALVVRAAGGTRAGPAGRLRGCTAPPRTGRRCRSDPCADRIRPR